MTIVSLVWFLRCHPVTSPYRCPDVSAWSPVVSISGTSDRVTTQEEACSTVVTFRQSVQSNVVQPTMEPVNEDRKCLKEAGSDAMRYKTKQDNKYKDITLWKKWLCYKVLQQTKCHGDMDSKPLSNVPTRSV